MPERWRQKEHEIVVIAWHPERTTWSITWQQGTRVTERGRFAVVVTDAYLSITDWVEWRRQTLRECWLPDAWSSAMIAAWRDTEVRLRA